MDKLTEAKSQDEIIGNIELFKHLPRVIESWHTLYARCITRQYRTFFGYEGGKAVFVVFFSTDRKNRKNKHAHVCGAFGRKKMQRYVESFYTQLKEEGYNSVSANSVIPSEKFEKMTRLKKSYSVYHNKL